MVGLRLRSANSRLDNSASSFLFLTVQVSQYQIGGMFVWVCERMKYHSVAFLDVHFAFPKKSLLPIYNFWRIAFLSKIKVEIWNFHEALNCAGMHWLHIFELGIWRNLTMYIPLKRPAGLFVSCSRNFRSWSWCGVTIAFSLNQFLLGPRMGQTEIFLEVFLALQGAPGEQAS